MNINTTYKVKIKDSHGAFNDTVELYRKATGFFIGVCLKEWDGISQLTGTARNNMVEHLTITTKKNPSPKYPFPFYKFPSYLRRAAISEAIGKVSSYKSNLANWEANPQGKTPGLPTAGYIYPAMYRDNCFVRTGTYAARLKVWIRNTWDWLDVQLKPTDVKYIQRRCRTRKECVPTLRRRGKTGILTFLLRKK